jgi:predicted alpha/beta hydrolase
MGVWSGSSAAFGRIGHVHILARPETNRLSISLSKYFSVLNELLSCLLSIKNALLLLTIVAFRLKAQNSGKRGFRLLIFLKRGEGGSRSAPSRRIEMQQMLNIADHFAKVG